MMSRPDDFQLSSEEKLLWRGQPKQGICLQGSDLIMIPFSIMWGGFALFWEAGVLGEVYFHPNHHPPGNGAVSYFFVLWGIPFVFAGLYMMVGRFFYDAALRKRTWYAITSTHVIVVRGLLARETVAYDIGSLSNLHLVERSDGSGDILFGLPAFPAQPRMIQNRPGSYQQPGFYLLPDVRTAYPILQEAVKAQTRLNR